MLSKKKKLFRVKLNKAFVLKKLVYCVDSTGFLKE